MSSLSDSTFFKRLRDLLADGRRYQRLMNACLFFALGMAFVGELWPRVSSVGMVLAFVSALIAVTVYLIAATTSDSNAVSRPASTNKEMHADSMTSKGSDPARVEIATLQEPAKVSPDVAISSTDTSTESETPTAVQSPSRPEPPTATSTNWSALTLIKIERQNNEVINREYANLRELYRQSIARQNPLELTNRERILSFYLNKTVTRHLLYSPRFPKQELPVYDVAKLLESVNTPVNVSVPAGSLTVYVVGDSTSFQLVHSPPKALETLPAVTYEDFLASGELPATIAGVPLAVRSSGIN